MDELAIRVIDVKKKYRRGAIGGATLTEELQTKWALKRGKKDPNAMVGTDYGGKKEFWALNGVSFVVRKGEALGIIGYNGAGKSTLLKILSQITAPTEGEAYIKGRITSMLEVGTGFHGELSGRENIYLNGAILGMSKVEIDSKIEDIIDFSECREFIDTPVKRYSSGMYVKLAFAVASHLDSEIMIMDEVLAVGDVKFQQKCLSKMKELVEKQNRTVLFVSHNMNTIRMLCTRCIVLEKGGIIFNGSCEEAVKIYLNESNSDKGLKKILKDVLRPLNSLNEIRLLSCEILDRKNNVFDVTDELILKIKYRANKDVERCGLRIMFVDSVGNRFASFSSGENNQKLGENKTYYSEIRLPLLYFEEGYYYADMAFYKVNDAKENVILDHVTHAFSMQILKTGREMVWQNRWWGNINLGGFKIEAIELDCEESHLYD